MKIICDDIGSKEIVDIFRKFDHREIYKSVKSIELTKRFISRRENLGDPMAQVEVNCILVSGTTFYGYDLSKTSTGTRYVYEHEPKLFEPLYNWYINQISKSRNNKIEELGI